MTNKEAIETLKVAKSEIEWEYPMDYQIALDKAIKALEQESILDKIRAEIDDLSYYWWEDNPRSVINDVLKIIDKYKVESDGKEHD